ncbi:pilus assembly protein TadG-related protein [Pseudomonas proteolytica]|nr:pilus assembly protein TadG-related protein [Pseudomonas proteolytica]USX00335.1 pilus assembly protein TadG-related protein [Pseudomonas proteolytica]
MSPRLRSGQRGAIGLVFAGTLALALVFLLLVVDSGRLYLEKRKLQAVADTAALEAANRGGQCAGSTTAVDYAKQNATRNGFTVVANDSSRALAVTCGTLLTNALNTRVFTADATKNEAIRVVATRTITTGIANGVWRLFSGTYNANTTLTATAVAALATPVAALTIRSTAVVVDTDKKASVLNALFGGLLGGGLNLSVAGWNGLINTNISLLSYLDRLKLDLGLTAVGYTEVLGNTLGVGQLIQSAINVLDPTNTLTTDVTIVGLKALKTAAGATQVVLGDILQIASGTDVASLAVNMRVFDLIEGFVQLANKKNGLLASVPIDLPGVAQITATVQVLQPPQLSAVGNPAKAVAAGHNPETGPNRIYVRTSQLRVLLSVNLPVLDTVVNLVNGVTGLAGPLASTVGALLHLDIVGAINALTCGLGALCTSPSLQILPPPVHVDIAVEAASASSWVTAYSCASPTNKSLTTSTNTSLVNLKLGQVDGLSSIFGSSQAPPQMVVKPLKVVDIGTESCRRFLVLNDCNARVPSVGGGIGLSANIDVGGSKNLPHTYLSPDLPEISQQPFYFPYTTSNIVSGLTDPAKGTAAGLVLNMYGPQPGNENLLGSLIGGLGTTLNSVTSLLISTIKTTLTPLLDSLINTLLLALGVDLNKVDVGANLSCQAGRAYLVI